MPQRRLIRGAVLGVLVAALLGGAVFADRSGVVCLVRGSPGPATHTTGPLVVATDASVYAPDASATFTVTNHLDSPIALFPDILFIAQKCSGIALERRVGADWQEADLVHCNNAGDAPPPTSTGGPEEVATGLEGGTRIDLGGSLQAGSYRYVARYVLVDPSKPDVGPGPYFDSYPTATRIFSQPFQICTCAICS